MKEAPLVRALSNGAAIAVQRLAWPEVQMAELLFRGGALEDPPGLSGTTHLLEHVLADAVSERVTRAGGRLYAFTDVDRLRVALAAPPRVFARCLRLVAIALSEIEVTGPALRRARRDVLQERRHMVDGNPAARALEAGFHAAARRGTPMGAAAEVARVWLGDCRALADRLLRADRLSVALVGPLAPARLADLAAEAFSGRGWTRSLAPTPELTLGPPACRVSIELGLGPRLAVLVFRAPSAADPAWRALQESAAAQVSGAGLASGRGELVSATQLKTVGPGLLMMLAQLDRAAPRSRRAWLRLWQPSRARPPGARASAARERAALEARASDWSLAAVAEHLALSLAARALRPSDGARSRGEGGREFFSMPVAVAVGGGG